MIDPKIEDVLSPSRVTKLPEARVNNKSPHQSTVWRWISLGARDLNGNRVRLETIRTPSGVMTSRQAFARFIAALNGVDRTECSNATRESQINQVERELAAAGIA